MCQKCTISHYIINDKKHQRKVGRICCSIPQSSIWCICRLLMIFLENLSGSPLKSTSALSPMNPPKIHINTTGNLWKIPEESTLKIPFNFRVDSCLNFHPNFRVDSSPPSIHHPRGFPAECGDFACWVIFLVHCLVTQTHSMINRAWIGIGFLVFYWVYRKELYRNYLGIEW